jgi:hypothetical protein
MNIVPSDLNEGLALAIRRRVVAERSLIFGKVGFWHLVGTGVVIFGLGCAVGLGFYGYSQIIKRTENLNAVASIFSKALANAQLHATADGAVQLEPHDLFLAKDQTIALSNDSRVSLDRSSAVKADGELKIQLPSLSVPPVATPPKNGKMPLVTNFTEFKSVPFEKGMVMTGWNGPAVHIGPAAARANGEKNAKKFAMMPLSQTAWRLVGRPLKITATLLPPIF